MPPSESFDPPGRAPGSRVEVILARIGLTLGALLALGGLLILDASFAPEGARTNGRLREYFGLHLVTRAGDDVGGNPSGVQLELSPFSFYRNHERQSGPLYQINEHGLRGGAMTPAPPGGRVIVVGGSAAFGLLVEEHALFETRLDEVLTQVQILNGGVVGYLSAQQLALTTHSLLDLEPDLIVIFDGWNDVFDRYWWAAGNAGDARGPHPDVNNGFGALESRLASYRRIELSPRAALREFLGSVFRNSRILAPIRDFRSEVTPLDPTRFGPAQLDRAIRLYVANQRKMRDFAASRGAGVLVVLQPERGQWSTAPAAERFLWPGYWPHFPPHYRRFRERVVPALQALGIAAVDASAALATEAAPDDLFTDPVHLSETGHARIASLLEPLVARASKAARHNEKQRAQEESLGAVEGELRPPSR